MLIYLYWSFGLQLLYCVACCEPYHWYCAEGPSAFREEAELEKCRVNWICLKCKVCSTCGKGGDLRTLSSCKRCRNSYHSECLNNKALNKRLFKSDRPWVREKFILFLKLDDLDIRLTLVPVLGLSIVP